MNLRTRMACMRYSAWEIEVAVIIVECMSVGVIRNSFTRKDLRDYYHVLLEHFQSDDMLEERINRALEVLTGRELVKLNDNEYKLVEGGHLHEYLELRIIGHPAGRHNTLTLT